MMMMMRTTRRSARAAAAAAAEAAGTRGTRRHALIAPSPKDVPTAACSSLPLARSHHLFLLLRSHRRPSSSSSRPVQLLRPPPPRRGSGSGHLWSVRSLATSSSSSVSSTSGAAGGEGDEDGARHDGHHDRQQPQQQKEKVKVKVKEEEEDVVKEGDVVEQGREFERLGVPARLLPLLRTHFGVLRPSPIQTLAIPAILEGTDVVMGAETGSGKTLAYLLPLLHMLTRNPPPRAEATKKFPAAIVLLPNRELCEQVLSVCQKITPPFLSVKTLNGNELPNRRPDILLATPEGLSRALHDDMLPWVRHIIVDEADLMLSPVYHDKTSEVIQFFRRETRRERKSKSKQQPAPASGTQSLTRTQKVQFVFVAATIPLQDKSKSFSIYLQKHFPGVRQVYTQHFHRSLPNISVSFLPMPEDPDDRIQSLIDVLRTRSGVQISSTSTPTPEHRDTATTRETSGAVTDELERRDNATDSLRPSRPKSTLIFVNSQLSVDDLLYELQSKGLQSCVPFHREMPAAQANKNLKDFLEGKVDVMVSTNLASRGIDFVGVEHVIQYHFAQSLVDHIHRVGRTGRGGRSGEVTCFYREEDRPVVNAIRQAEEQNAQITIQFKPTPEKYKLPKRRLREAAAATATARANSSTTKS